MTSIESLGKAGVKLRHQRAVTGTARFANEWAASRRPFVSTGKVARLSQIDGGLGG
jgi:hypothetical protein